MGMGGPASRVANQVQRRKLAWPSNWQGRTILLHIFEGDETAAILGVPAPSHKVQGACLH